MFAWPVQGPGFESQCHTKKQWPWGGTCVAPVRMLGCSAPPLLIQASIPCGTKTWPASCYKLFLLNLSSATGTSSTLPRERAMPLWAVASQRIQVSLEHILELLPTTHAHLHLQVEVPHHRRAPPTVLLRFHLHFSKS